MRRRRIVLAALWTTFAGCTGDESGPNGFAAAVRDRFEVQAFSRQRERWVLEYHVDEGPVADARRIAPPYADHVPDAPHRELEVSALSRENRLVAEYRIPADWARDRREGRLDADRYRGRVTARAREGRQ